MTVFFFLLAFNSPLLFNALHFSGTAVINGITVMYILGAIVLFIINQKTNKDDILSSEKSSISQIIILGILGIFGSILLQGILMMIEVNVFNQAIGSQNTSNVTDYVKTAPFFLFAATVGGPIMEEFVFRFSLIRFFNQKLDIWTSAIISSLLFAIMHQDGHYLLYTGLGFFFFLLNKKTGSIYTSIITHVGMNAVVMFAQLMLA